tara:strand:+ start:528 stop:1007 length:480 start_codon:yes stop_codon:yes gene_type:complete
MFSTLHIKKIILISLGLAINFSSTVNAQDYPELIQSDWPETGDHLYLNDVLHGSTVPGVYAASGFIVYRESKVEITTYDNNFEVMKVRATEPYRSMAFSSVYDCNLRSPVKSFSVSYYADLPYGDNRGLIHNVVGAQNLPEATNRRLRERVCEIAIPIS